MVYDRSEWRGFVRENAWGIASGMNSSLDEATVVDYYGYTKPLNGGSLSVVKPTT